MSGREETDTRALVLRTVDYADADRVVTLLTEDWGRCGVFAAGARKSKRRYAGALEPLRVIRARLRQRSGSALHLLLGAQVEEGFDTITRELHTLYWASLTLEWTAELAVEGEPSLVFETLVALLRWLGTQERGPWFTEVGCLRYGLVLLHSAGSLPSFGHCIRSGVPLDSIAEPYYSFEAGGLLDPAQLRPEDRARPVSREAISSLAQIAGGHFPTERAIEILRQVRGMVLEAFRHLTGADPHALGLLRTLWL